MASAIASISSHSSTVLRDVKGDISFCLFSIASGSVRSLRNARPNFDRERIGLKYPLLSMCFSAARIGSVRPQVAAAGQRARAVRPLRAAEPGRQPVSASAAAPVALVAVDFPAAATVPAVDYEALAQELEGASPLEAMDRALAMFGSEIAIAFRCVLHYLHTLLPGSGSLLRAPVTRWLVVDCVQFRRAAPHHGCSRHLPSMWLGRFHALHCHHGPILLVSGTNQQGSYFIIQA
jgi:hypothetical protein